MKKTIRHFLDRIGRYNRVVEDYKKATESAPDHALAFVNWGVDLAMAGQMDEALDKFQQASDIAPHRFEPFLNWGVALARTNQLDAAIEKFKLAIEKEPKIAGPYMLWGAALVEQGKYDEAQEKYGKAIELSPENPEPYVNRGIAFARTGQYADAIANFKRALAMNGYQPEIFFLWGAVLAELQDYESAIEKFQLTLRFTPKHAEAWYFISVALNRLGRYEEALEKSRKAISLSLEKPEVYLNQGDILANLNRLDVAIGNYKQAILLDPESAEAYLSWGVALCRLEQYEEGFQKFEKADELQEELSGLQKHWGHYLLQVQRYDEALKHLQRAAEQTPDDIALLLDISMSLIKTERLADAIALLFEIEKKDRWNPQMHYLLGTHFMGAGDLQNASSHFNKALEERPDFDDAAINLALVLCELGETLESVRRMRPLIRKYPDSPRINFFYGTILYRHGDYAEAQTKYEKAIQLSPDYVEPQIGLGEVFLQAGNVDAAIAQFKNIVAEHVDSIPALFLYGMSLMKAIDSGNTENQQVYSQLAIQQFNQVLLLEPEHFDSLINRAYLQGLSESVEVMNASFELLVLAFPQRIAWIYYYWAEALRKLGQTSDADLKQQQALEKDPSIIERVAQGRRSSV